MSLLRRAMLRVLDAALDVIDRAMYEREHRERIRETGMTDEQCAAAGYIWDGWRWVPPGEDP